MDSLLLCLVLSNVVVCVLGSCFLPGFPPAVLTIPERTPNGTLVLNVSTTDNITLSVYPSSELFFPPFLEARDGALYTNAKISLDGDPALCGNRSSFAMNVHCASSADYVALNFIEVILSDDYPPEFTSNFSVTIPELTAVGTTIFTIWDHSDTIEDRDCGANIQESNTFFALENYGTSFRLQTYFKGNVLVNRLLDFDNGDTYLPLNISVGARLNDTRRTFGLLEVFITDIDDNDPVFNSSLYTLHVLEHDNSSLVVWQNTTPPIDAYDQDFQVNDPLTYSLFNASDNTTVIIDKTNPHVKLQRVFDREKEPSTTVILKVQQVNNNHSSATAMLTIIVDDINDNRPLFSPNSYSVTIAEHSAIGTTVALVSATDLDEGENAEFDYVLHSGNDRLQLRNESIGLQIMGVVTVKDPALLDRETSAQILVTVGTREKEREIGNSCNASCNATITITLTDINDNKPVFYNSSDTEADIDPSTSPNHVIATVTTSDADEGLNAEITYSFQPSQFSQNFRIDNKTGKISLHQYPETTADFVELTILATDGGTPSLSATQTLRVMVAPGNETVSLDAPVPASVLEADRATIQEKLTQILGVTVSVDRITPLSESRSYVYISGTNKTSGEKLSKIKLQRLVDNKSEEIYDLFKRYVKEQTADDNDDNYFTPPLIALIAFSAVLLIALIILIILFNRKSKNFSRQKSLFQNLSRTNTMYESAGQSTVEDGTPILDGEDEEDQNSAVGVVNPVYESTTSSSVEVTPRQEEDVTQRKEVEPGEAEQDAEVDHKRPERGDADSGVPSENGENGAEDTDSESENNKGHERTQSGGGTSYLDAVLLRNDQDLMDLNDDDMADVTMPPMDYHMDEAPQIEGVPEDAVTQPPEEPPVDVEEQETVMSFDNDAGEADYLGEVDSALVASAHDPHEFAKVEEPPAAFVVGGEEEDDDEDVPIPVSGLAAAMMAKPPTPPPVHKSRNADEEEEEEELPDEPEPDYAKKVRFSTQVIEHSDSKDTHDGDDNYHKDTDGSDVIPSSPTEEHKSIQEIDGTPRELKDDDEPTFHFNIDDEITTF